MSVDHATEAVDLPEAISISKAAALDDRLSYAARGVLLDLMSRPGSFPVNADSFSRAARAARGEARGEGRRAMRVIFTELEEAGYIRREKRRTASGQFVTNLIVTDAPGRQSCRGAEPSLLPEAYEPDGRSVVYVVGDGRSNVVKIGITQNLKSRLKSLQTSSPYQLRALCVFQGGVDLETHLHKRFKTRRLQGEWFDFGVSNPVAVVREAVNSFLPSPRSEVVPGECPDASARTQRQSYQPYREPTPEDRAADLGHF